MTAASVLTILFYALFIMALVGLPLLATRFYVRQYRGAARRSYSEVVQDMFHETERRGTFLLAFANSRLRRLERY